MLAYAVRSRGDRIVRAGTSLSSKAGAGFLTLETLAS
jgi:hypothetical protein